MSFDDDMRYFRSRQRAHGMDYEPGNRRHGYGTTETRGTGPTALEIALVRKLGNKVRLYSRDFLDVRDCTVHRTEDPTDDSVILEVRDKNDARGKLIDLVRQPDGSYGVDQYAGL